MEPFPPWHTETKPSQANSPQIFSEEEKPSSTGEIFSPENNLETKQLKPSFRKTRGVGSILCSPEALESAQLRYKFLRGLKKCKLPEDIQKLATGLSIDLRSTPMYSKLAFEHMLRIGSKLSMLVKFFESSSLNAPAARNLHSLLLWHVTKKANGDDKRLLQLWIRDKVAQEWWRGEKLSHLLESVRCMNGMIETENSDCSFSRSIFEGLSSSTVFTIHDVAGSALNILLESVTPWSMSRNGELLGIEMMKRSSTSQLQVMGEGISWFLRECLLPRNRHQKVEWFDRKIVAKLLKLLQRAPSSTEVKSIAGATIALLVCREYVSASRSTLLKNIRAWWSLLIRQGVFKMLGGNSQWVEVERILAHQNVDILATYLQLLRDDEKCCFLLRNWFIPEIHSEPTCQLGKAQHIENEFRHELSLPRARLSPFVTMLQSLGSNLPASSKWISPLFSLLRELGRSPTVLEIASFNQVLGLRISTIAIVYEISENAKSQPHIAYHLFKSTPNIPLEACPVVAEIMIQNPRFHPFTAHLYRRNRQKFLSVPELFVAEPKNILRKFTREFPRGGHQEIRNYRAALLDRMALAYAQAVHLYPGVAYRNVYRCYRLQKWYRLGPVSIDMSRALTIAGAVRPLQEGKWVRTMRMRWILKVVNQAEGEKIARAVDELCYRWRTEVMHKTDLREMWEQRQREMSFVVPPPVRKKLIRVKTLARWVSRRKTGDIKKS